MEVLIEPLEASCPCNTSTIRIHNIEPNNLTVNKVNSEQIRIRGLRVNRERRLDSLRLEDLSAVFNIPCHESSFAYAFAEINAGIHVVAEHHVLHVRVHLHDLVDVNIVVLGTTVVPRCFISGERQSFRLVTEHRTPGELCCRTILVQPETRQVNVVYFLPVSKRTDLLAVRQIKSGASRHNAKPGLTRRHVQRNGDILHTGSNIHLASLALERLFELLLKSVYDSLADILGQSVRTLDFVMLANTFVPCIRKHTRSRIVVSVRSLKLKQSDRICFFNQIYDRSTPVRARRIMKLVSS